MRARAGTAMLLVLACTRHDVDIELPASRALTSMEQREFQRIAEATFREVRGVLPGLPEHLTLIVRWGKDVIAETGENGTASYPANIAWTLDPDRDALVTIRTQLRPTLFHELHHLARASRVTSHSLADEVVTEGLATAFERDYAKVDPLWAKAPPEEWVHEVLGQPSTADRDVWMHKHPDGRRWIGMRVGTLLVDRAAQTSGKNAVALVFAPTAEILREANVP